jgi:hypothetical protein
MLPRFRRTLDIEFKRPTAAELCPDNEANNSRCLSSLPLEVSSHLQAMSAADEAPSERAEAEHLRADELE